MKALFIRCNGKLTPDMLVGGLIAVSYTHLTLPTNSLV